MQPTPLGKRIKLYREALGLSQFDLELEISASPGSISRIEKGRTNPTKETLIKISQVLKLSPEQITLLFGIGEEPPTKEDEQKVLKEISHFMQDPNKFGYLTDSWWVFRKTSDSLKHMFKSEGIDVDSLIGVNIMDILLDQKYKVRQLFAPSNIDNILRNQVCFFKQQIGERVNTSWGKEVTSKFFVYDEFKKYWDEAENINASFYSDRDRELIFQLETGPVHFLCSPRMVQSDSRFELVEFEPKG